MSGLFTCKTTYYPPTTMTDAEVLKLLKRVDRSVEKLEQFYNKWCWYFADAKPIKYKSIRDMRKAIKKLEERNT